MRKMQLFLVTCFVAVSFFALPNFIDSNAWGDTPTCKQEGKNEKPKEGEKKSKKQTDSGWCILWQDLNIKASWGYTDSTSKLEEDGIPVLGFEIKDTETYSVGIGFSDKKIISQILNHRYNYKSEDREGWLWDFGIDPFEINAGIKFSREFKDTGQNVVQSQDLKDDISFNVGIVYNLPLEKLYWNFAN